MRTLPILPLLAALALSSARADQPLPLPVETRAQKDARMAWWRDARFGMFVHWGLYCVPAGDWNGATVPSAAEWIMNTARIPITDYEKLVPQFDPVKFNAREWVRLAKAAGMRYIVLTSKHHEGFCMWDTKMTAYSIMATPYKKDVVRQLADACREENMKLGLYYSIMDWHHPDAQGRYFPDYGGKTNPDWPEYVTYMKGELKELLTNYGPISVLWFDGEWVKEWTEPQGEDLYAYCRSLQPSIVINNRVTKNRGGMSGVTAGNKFGADFGTPEQQIPANGMPGVDWESCMTMNDTWGFKKSDHSWKSVPTLIHNLVDIASKGGNYLLNVGPTSEGEIPQPSVERLQAVGQWMSINGDSIHGTTSNPFPKAPQWGRITRKGDTLYLHVFNWPKDGLLPLDSISQGQIGSAWLLSDASKTPLIASAEASGLALKVPATAPDAIDTVVALRLKPGSLPAAGNL